jgi:tRNA A-37 threonylcarbamoyl transferase component Bud32
MVAIGEQQISHWCVELPQGQHLSICCAGAFDTSALRELLEHIQHLPDHAHTLKRDPQSSIVSRVAVDGRDIVIKNSVNQGWLKLLRRCWRRSRARNAWHFSHLLQAAGIDTPTPMALVERKWGPLVLESWFVCEYLDADNLLDVWLYQEPSAREVDFIGKLFRVMKQLKMNHGDMKATNLLVADDKIYLIDFDGARQHVLHARLMYALMRDKQRFLCNWQKPELEKLLRERIDQALAG